MMDSFNQFKSILITGLSSLVLVLVIFAFNTQAEAIAKQNIVLDKAVEEIADVKLAVVELKIIVVELKKSNDRLTELLDYERTDHAPVARPRSRGSRD